MRRWLALALSLPLLSCVEGDPGFRIDNVVAPTDACLFTPGGTALFGGNWDLDFPVGYLIGVAVSSQIRTRASDINPDAQVVRIIGLEVELRDDDGETVFEFPAPFVNPYMVRAAGTIASVDGPGETASGVIATLAIPEEYIPPLRDRLGPNPASTDFVTILVALRAVGRTVGGVGVTSREFLFPINLCVGCLEDCTQSTNTCVGGQDGNTYCTGMVVN